MVCKGTTTWAQVPTLQRRRNVGWALVPTRYGVSDTANDDLATNHTDEKKPARSNVGWALVPTR